MSNLKLYTVWIVFYVTVVLQCFPRCYLACDPKNSTVTLELFVRQNLGRRFLLMTENNGQFTISFTGRKGQNGTKFIWTKTWTASNLEFTLRPAGWPDFILSVDKGQLAAKNSSVDAGDTNCKLEKRTITLKYHDNLSVKERFGILVFQSSPRAVIKGDRSGSVFLDKGRNWKDSQAWIKIRDKKCIV